MIFVYFLLLVSVFGCLPIHRLNAVLDGRAAVITVDSMYTFTDGEYALGFVHFNRGFTVSAGQTAYIGVIPRVNGPINLNQTGRIYLSAPLRLGPSSTGFTAGGIIHTNDGEQGVITFDNNTDLSKQLILKNSMLFDFGQHVFTLLSNGSNRGSLMIDNTVSQTVVLRNGLVRGVEDFSTGFGPRLRASATTGGRHGYTFENIDARFMSDGTMTATGYDLSFVGFYNSLTCLKNSLIHLRAGLYINDLTEVLVNQGLELRLDTTLGTSYFSVGHGGGLVLNNATFSYSKPIAFPSPYLAKNMISRLAVLGESGITALGSGADTHLTIGGSTTYDYDAFIDIYPYASMQLDNAALINYNSQR